YELRTSGYGVNRAGKGLYLTAYDRPAASGKQLDMQETIAQLESALATAKALAASASSAKAEPADTDAQQQVKDDLDGLKKPGILISTPASAALVTGQGLQLAATDNISAVAGKNADWSVLKQFTVAAGDKISLFAQKFGIKIFAGKGPIEIQAQSDAMSLVANKDVSVSSVNGAVYIRAQKELTLESGEAFIQLKNGSITLGGPLDLFIKTITIQKAGKASMSIPIPAFPLSLEPDEEVIRQSFSLLKDGTTPVDGYHYDLYRDDGLHTQRGEYSGGDTTTISGQSPLKLVTWMAQDSARKDA
ncbi:DUF2345 domain-containing protein, partial [Paraburkholderia graminis]